jgi:hypothetical protein
MTRSYLVVGEDTPDSIILMGRLEIHGQEDVFGGYVPGKIVPTPTNDICRYGIEGVKHTAERRSHLFMSKLRIRKILLVGEQEKVLSLI